MNLHPEVRYCKSCDRYCPVSVLSTCDQCGGEACDDCSRAHFDGLGAAVVCKSCQDEMAEKEMAV